MMTTNPRHLLKLPTGFAAAFLTLALIGCTPDGPDAPIPPIRSNEPLSIQIVRREPDLKGLSFRILLDFESPEDLAFVSTDRPCDQPPPTSAAVDPHAPPAAASIGGAVAHTGSAAMALPPGASEFCIHLADLPGMALFPSHWTLAGGYFYSKDPASITISYDSAGKSLASNSVDLKPGRWTPVLVDVSTLTDPNTPSAPVGSLRFKIKSASQSAAITPATIWCDDVIVIDNDRLLTDAPAGASHGINPSASTSREPLNLPHPGDTNSLSVHQRGYHLTIDGPSDLHLDLSTRPDDSKSWTIVESSPARIILHGNGPTKTWTLYANGWEYLDSHFDAAIRLTPSLTAILAAEHAAPAELIIPPELGRLDRNTPGDDDNDAYNEHTGAYQLVAHGPRLEVTICPHTRVIQNTALEIAGFPPGNVLITVEGQLVPGATRLNNGHLLVVIPTAIERPTTVNMRVQ